MAGNKEIVFITEVDVPSNKPPAPVVSQPLQHVQPGGAVAPLNQGGRYLVKDLYDFPSVQNLKVVNGSNMPFRYLVKPPGRAPLWRVHQGKKVTPAGQKMVKHQAIFNPARVADGAAHAGGHGHGSASASARASTGEVVMLPLVDRPDAVAAASGPPSSVGMRAGPYALPPEAGREAQALQARPAVPYSPGGGGGAPRPRQGGAASTVDSVASRRSDAAFYKDRQRRHSTSIVGSAHDGLGGSIAGSASRTAQRLKRQHAGFGGGGSSVTIPPTAPGGGGVTTHISKDTIGAIKKREGMDIPRGPPPDDAPPPVPSSPPASSVCESHLSQYDNLTSVSMRTPQTSHMTSNRGRGLSHLERSLQREEGRKLAVEKELTALRIRQEALINALSRQQKDELTKKLMQVG